MYCKHHTLPYFLGSGGDGVPCSITAVTSKPHSEFCTMLQKPIRTVFALLRICFASKIMRFQNAALQKCCLVYSMWRDSMKRNNFEACDCGRETILKSKHSEFTQEHGPNGLLYHTVWFCYCDKSFCKLIVISTIHFLILGSVDDISHSVSVVTSQHCGEFCM